MEVLVEGKVEIRQVSHLKRDHTGDIKCVPELYDGEQLIEKPGEEPRIVKIGRTGWGGMP